MQPHRTHTLQGTGSLAFMVGWTAVGMVPDRGAPMSLLRKRVQQWFSDTPRSQPQTQPQAHGFVPEKRQAMRLLDPRGHAVYCHDELCADVVLNAVASTNLNDSAARFLAGAK